jgi:hypothetical protein
LIEIVLSTSISEMEKKIRKRGKGKDNREFLPIHKTRGQGIAPYAIIEDIRNGRIFQESHRDRHGAKSAR